MLLALSISAWMANSAGSATRLRGEDVVVPLLILALGVALGMCFAGLLIVLHYLRAGKVESLRDSVRLPSYLHAPKFSTRGWEGDFRWIAVRSTRPRSVQEALALRQPIACTWEEGLTAAHHEKLFISPAVGGWILVFGSNLPEIDDVDRCYRFLLELSRKLGHVQYFAVNRVLNHHAWVQAEQGNILRGYGWAGRTVWNQGARTSAELELGVTCFDYTDEPHRLLFGGADLSAANTEKVFRLARRWSIDPTTIDSRLLIRHQGIAGEISRSRMG